MAEKNKMPYIKQGTKQTNQNCSIESNEKPIAVCYEMKGKVNSDVVGKYSSDFTPCRLGSAELIQSIKDGYAYCAQYTETRKSNNFKETGFLSVDIDWGLKIEKALEKEYIKNYASFIYTTASHTEDAHKFRVVFELEKPIGDVTAVIASTKGLLTLFPEADQNCKDPCRIFFGSPGCKVYEINKVLTEEECKRLAELGQETPKVMKQDTKKDSLKTKSAISTDDIRKMLGCINKMPGYDIWRNVNWSLKSWCVQNQIDDSVGKDLIEEWSPDYKTHGLEIDKLFQDYKHGCISIGTLIFYAKEGGYDIPKRFTKPRMPGQVILEDLLCPQNLYVAISGNLHKYKEGVYELIDDQELEKLISEYFDTYITDFNTGKTGFANRSRIQDAIGYIKAKLYKGPERINPPGINLRNCYLKLHYDECGNPQFTPTPHSEEYIFTYMADFDYDPEADSEIFDEAVGDILEPKELDIVLRVISSSFDLGEVRKRQGRTIRGLLLFGEGSNGKDTIREWLQKLYGEKAISTVPLQAFKKADSGRSFALYDVAFCRVNWSSENSATSLDDCQTLKNCITGDSVYVEKKNCQGFSTKVKSIFLFNVNDIPRLKGKLEAIASRYGVINFPNTFKLYPDESNSREKQANPKFKDDEEFILCEIMPAFLNRLILSFKDLLISGVDYSPCHAVLQEIREQNDHFAEFLSDNPMQECDVKEGMKASKIYQKYVQWCEDVGLIEDVGGRKVNNDPSSQDKIVGGANNITRKLLEYFPKLGRRRSQGKRILCIKFLLDD